MLHENEWLKRSLKIGFKVMQTVAEYSQDLLQNITH